MNKQETHLSASDFKRQPVESSCIGKRVYVAHKDTVGTFIVTNFNNFAMLPERTTVTLFSSSDGEEYTIASDIRGQLPLTLPSAVLFMKTCDIGNEEDVK